MRNSGLLSDKSFLSAMSVPDRKDVRSIASWAEGFNNLISKTRTHGGEHFKEFFQQLKEIFPIFYVCGRFLFSFCFFFRLFLSEWNRKVCFSGLEMSLYTTPGIDRNVYRRICRQTKFAGRSRSGGNRAKHVLQNSWHSQHFKRGWCQVGGNVFDFRMRTCFWGIGIQLFYLVAAYTEQRCKYQLFQPEPL